MGLWGNETTEYTEYTERFCLNWRIVGVREWTIYAVGQQPTLTPAYAVGADPSALSCVYASILLYSKT